VGKSIVAKLAILTLCLVLLAACSAVRLLRRSDDLARIGPRLDDSAGIVPHLGDNVRNIPPNDGIARMEVVQQAYRATGLDTADLRLLDPWTLDQGATIYVGTLPDGTSRAVIVSATDRRADIAYAADLLHIQSDASGWRAVVGGRSANILLQRRRTSLASDSRLTATYPFPSNEGQAMRWQVGNIPLEVPGLTPENLARLLDPEQPLANRAALEIALVDMLRDGTANSLVLVSNMGQNLVDMPELAMWLKAKTGRSVHVDPHPEVARNNLHLNQKPFQIENTVIVIDRESLNPVQAQYVDQIPQQLQAAGVSLPAEQMMVLAEDIEIPGSNVILLTAENQTGLTAKLTRLGETRQLVDKFIVAFTCGDPVLRDFVGSGIVARYGSTGMRVFADKVPVEAVVPAISEMLSTAQAQPYLSPSDLVDQAIAQLIAKVDAGNPALEPWYARIRNNYTSFSVDEFRSWLQQLLDRGWNQISLRDSEVSLAAPA
jgi:hypothetical protein